MDDLARRGHEIPLVMWNMWSCSGIGTGCRVSCLVRSCLGG